MNWKDLKIAKKLYIGFGAVLVLAILVGYVGWNGLNTVGSAVQNANEANTLVKAVKDMGAARQAYLNTKDKSKYEQVMKTTDEMFTQMDVLKSRLDDQSHVALLDRARQKTDEYRKVWGNWVEITESTQKAMDAITADANIAQEQFFAMRDKFKADLDQAVASGAGKAVLERKVKKNNSAAGMVADYLDMRVAYRNYLILDDKKYSEQFLDFTDGIAAQAEEAMNLAETDGERGQLNTIISACRGLHSSMVVVVEKTDGSKEAHDQLAGLAGEVVTAMNDLLDTQDKLMSDSMSTAVTLAVSFLAGAILVGLFIAFTIARGISNPVSNMATIAQQIAVGDIDHTITLQSRDEIGILAGAFRQLIDYMKELAGAAERIASNDLTVKVTPKSDKDILSNSFKTMTLNLSTMVRQMGENASQLVAAATEVASSAEQMSRGAKDQTDQMTQIATAIEEMTATIVESSKNASEASDGARGAADTAGTGGQVVSNTIQGMQRIAAVVRESAESISKLARSADQIGEIIGVIDDIADQTNLLALNAAIEAARAGEQGRGFAVVADEVRKLAERTGKATGEITGMIKGIQDETEEAVKSMETGIQEVDKGRELADKAGNSLNEIVTMSQRVTDMIQQIATATNEQSSAAEQISKNVESVSSIVRESASGAQQSAAAAEELNRQAEGMQKMVAQFKIAHQE